MFQPLYSRFLKSQPGKLHFSPHSHHFWPDITRQAVLECWDDAAASSDNKWGKVFTEVIPKTQSHIAKRLNFSRPNDISFDQNTLNLVYKVKILTTQNQFLSFSRLSSRLEQLQLAQVKRVDGHVAMLQSPEKFFDQVKLQIAEYDPDFIYLSHTMYNNGFYTPVDKIKEYIEVCGGNPVIMIDGYHSFNSIPIDLSPIEDRVFFIAGGYKHAQAGEGVCFMTLPTDFKRFKPANTGWLTMFGELDKGNQKQSTLAKPQVAYANDGMRFIGATFDPMPFYKFNAVFDLFEKLELTDVKYYEYILKMQKYLKDKIEGDLMKIGGKILFKGYQYQAAFFAVLFEDDVMGVCEEFHKLLQKHNVATDRRGNVIRFGVAIYHDYLDIDKLGVVIKEIVGQIQKE